MHIERINIGPTLHKTYKSLVFHIVGLIDNSYRSSHSPVPVIHSDWKTSFYFFIIMVTSIVYYSTLESSPNVAIF